MSLESNIPEGVKNDLLNFLNRVNEKYSIPFDKTTSFSVAKGYNNDIEKRRDGIILPQGNSIECVKNQTERGNIVSIRNYRITCSKNEFGEYFEITKTSEIFPHN